MMNSIVVDPHEQFSLSPYLYMQFMEPLGATDGSVEAAWDHEHCRWKVDFLKVIHDLHPPMIRWGGCVSSFYRWKEGIGKNRIPMRNLLWGGMESNRVGTDEFLDLCRTVRSEPLIGVNFESDGRARWARPQSGGIRSGGPEEAADWVSYCNDPDDKMRAAHGPAEPYHVRFWQIGNETSYDKDGYDVETAGRRTRVFADAMRFRDPSIQLIGWGDSGWAPRMMEIAGDKIDYLAFHHMIRPERDPDSPLRGKENPIGGTLFRKDEARAWDYLMRIHEIAHNKIQRIRDETSSFDIPLMKTEGHFALDGRNRGEVLATWAAGVSNARIFHVHERNGDRLKVATGSDFFGTRWLVNSVMMPMPKGNPYLLPVGAVMKLYGKYLGEMSVGVTACPNGLDITASKTESQYILHVINTKLEDSIIASIQIQGRRILSAVTHTIACEPFVDIEELGPSALVPHVAAYKSGERMIFPAASVTAVVISTEITKR